MAVSVTAVQVPNELTLDVSWQLLPGLTAPTAQRLIIESSTGGGWGELWASAVPPGTTSKEVSLPLTAGQLVRAVVRVTYATALSEEGASVPIVVASGQLPIGGATPGAPVAVGFPDVVPMLQSSAGGDAGRRLAAKAAAAGAHYRSRYLKDQAAAVARDALAIENEIGQLQGLDLLKMVGAQLVAAPAIADAFITLSDQTSLAPKLPDLDTAIADLASAAQQLLLFQRILDWLARTDIIEFWYGLFRALIDDVAHADFDVKSTKAYLLQVFSSPSLASLADELLDEVTGMVDAQVSTFTRAVSDALGAATAAVSGSSRQLLASIDAPLLAAPVDAKVPVEPSAADVLDADPFDALLADLRDAVNTHLAAVRSQATAALGSLSAADDLFVALMVTYVALPVLAAVGIALAGGPAAAALLHAAVFIGGQELLHLVAKWLAGPIGEQLSGLRAKLDDAKAALVRTVAEATAAATGKLNTAADSIARRLHLAGLFLRELSHLAPDAFLTAAGELLSRQRDELLRQAGGLALAAELAQGAEHGTVFDAIRSEYSGATDRLPAATQLPGGASPNRFLAQTLLNDLHRLDEQRLELVDGTEMLLTKRFSLAGLASSATPATLVGTAGALGGTGQPAALDPLHLLLSGEPVAFALDEGDLLDGTHPGTYRALVDAVRVNAYVTPPVAAPNAIELLLTHDGTSATRVRRPGGAAEGLGEIALRTVLSDEVVLRAYRKSRDAARRWRNMPAQPTDLTPWWWNALAVSLWREVRAAAAANDLPDVSPMREDFRELLEGIRLPSAVDPATTTRAQLTGQLYADIAFRTEWVVVLFIPIPVVHSPYAVVGDTSTQDASDAQLATWAPGLAAWLRDRCRWLQSSPFRRDRKWGNHARLVDELEPALRNLGYQTLLRKGEPQALATELVPVGVAPHDPGQVLFAAADTTSLPGAGAGERRRPFENLGVGGTWVVQLPDAADDTTGLLSTARLRDLVLELDLRVCHDPQLEAAIRFARTRRRQLTTLVSTAAGVPVRLPGTTKTVAVGPGQRRTVQLSLRAHRQRAWIAWQQAKAALALQSPTSTTTADGLTIADIDTAGALTSDDFQVLKALTQPFRIEFAPAPATALADLAGTFVITPAHLGVGDQLAALLPSLNGDETGRLHTVGVSVVPTRDAPRLTASPPPGTMTFGPRLTSLVAPGATRPLWEMAITRTSVDTGEATSGVGFTQLFADPAKAFIDLDLGLGLDTAKPRSAKNVYDVIVTLVYSPPLVRLQPATTELL